MTIGPGLHLDRVIVRYGDRVAVDGLTLQVQPGEIVGLLGPNGSGKSTTLNVAAGLLHPAFGSARVDGFCTQRNAQDYARSIGYVPQDIALYDDLSAQENLSFFAQLYGFRGTERKVKCAQALSMAKLQDRAKARVGTFSGGMKQRLNLAAALMHNPRVVLLDEPTAALDPLSRETLYADLAALRDEGRAILLTTHHWDEAEMGCDRIVVLEKGKVVSTGTPAQVLRPAGQHLIYGHIAEWASAETVNAIQAQLEPGSDLEITGRRLRLSAPDSISLGRALAMVLACGLTVETFRTPPARWANSFAHSVR